MSQKIQFFTENVKFYLSGKGKLRVWLNNVILKENKKPWYVNFIFCNDEYLFELNKSYLGHLNLTDILTFSFSEKIDSISGDIYISVDRIRENALKYKVSFSEELHRVMVHGVLHLIGYKDGSKAEKMEMRTKEDSYLKELTL